MTIRKPMPVRALVALVATATVMAACDAIDPSRVEQPQAPEGAPQLQVMRAPGPRALEAEIEPDLDPARGGAPPLLPPGTGKPQVMSARPAFSMQVAAPGPVTHLIWVNSSTGTRGFWPMTGPVYNGGWDELAVVPNVWEIAGSADFTGDNRADIVWQNTSTGMRGVWPMNGTAYTGGWAEIGVIAPEWDIAAVGDYTGDGRADILWQNRTNGTRGIWGMNGTAYTGNWYPFGAIDTNWNIAATGDFTNDGKLDIVWEHTVSGYRGIWPLNNTVHTGEWFPIGGVHTDWKVAAAGDFDNDGRADWLWQNTATGMRGIWPMAGPVYSGGWFELGVVPTVWRLAGIVELPAHLPATPSNARIAGALATEVTVAWNDNATNETEFRIERRLLTGSFAQVGTAGANVTTFTSTGLTAGTTYEFRVRACNAGGCSGYSNLVQGTSLLSPPTSVTATTVNANQVTVGWTDNSPDETRFEVQRRPVGSTFWTTSNFPSPNATSTTVGGLAPSTTYEFRVRACRSSLCSVFTMAATTATTLAAPATPTNLGISMSTTAATLSWTDVATNETSYIVERAIGYNSYTTLATLAANATGYVDNTITHGNGHYYRVRACNANGCSVGARAFGTVAYNLTSGEVLSISNARLSEVWYRITVPAGTTTLFATLTGGEGDADLEIYGPDLTGPLCWSYNWYSNESCQIHKPAAGTYYVAVSGWSSYQFVQLQANAVTDAPGYGMNVQFVGGGWSPATMTAFNNAAARWNGLITTDNPGMFLNLTFFWDNVEVPVRRYVDDLHIIASIAPQGDGRGGWLAQAGGILLPSPNHSDRHGITKPRPIIAWIRFDPDDIGWLHTEGWLPAVSLHELGHALGVGVLWSHFSFGLMRGVNSDPYHTGTNARTQFTAIGGNAYTGTPVPIEPYWFGHWRESALTSELMTGWISSATNPLSKLTLGDLQDMGYTVNLNGADAFTYGTPVRDGEPQIDLSKDVVKAQPSTLPVAEPKTTEQRLVRPNARPDHEK